MQNRLEIDHNFNQKYFNEISESNLGKLFPKHVTVYAKNQQGLKDLYELVSLSHTKYLFKTPRITKTEIAKRKKNLIIGSACDKGEIFNAVAFDPRGLKEKVDFYDFFEIMPIDSMTHLIDKEILSKKQIEETYQDIYTLGKRNNKLVVATGNVHYINPHDKKIREVLVQNKGLGGTFHPLYDFRNRIKEIPDNYFRTTKTMKESFIGMFSKDVINEIVVKNSQLLETKFEYIKPIPDKLYPPKINDNPGKKLKELVYKNGEKLYGPNDK
jgi:DNA polymerase-3 subunit alpha (Gram-positive type)